MLRILRKRPAADRAGWNGGAEVGPGSLGVNCGRTRGTNPVLFVFLTGLESVVVSPDSVGWDVVFDVGLCLKKHFRMDT